MKLERCEKGHFYDAERFSVCPHCNPNAVSAPHAQPQQASPAVQAPAQSGAASTPSKRLDDIVNNAKGDDLEKTVGYFGSMEVDPVVGWLVAVAGSHFGEDFRLKIGRNFIGRSPNMDIQLSKDSSVSRERHAIVLYDPKANMFLVQPGDSKELFYCNDKVVLAPEKLNPGDILVIGSSKLLFIPCCTDSFNWDMVKKDK